MFFTGLIVFALSAVLPWYALSAAAFILGALLPGTWKDHLSLALAAAVTQAALAFWADGRLYGIVSQRMSGLFSLPAPTLIFLVMFVLAFITAFLWLRAGVFARQILRPGKF